MVGTLRADLFLERRLENAILQLCVPWWIDIKEPSCHHGQNGVYLDSILE